GCVQATSDGPVYTGANMPAGYTASALIWSGRTDGSLNIIAFFQTDRTVEIVSVTALTAGSATVGTAVGIAAIVPPNAKTIGGTVSSPSLTSGSNYIQSDAAGIGQVANSATQNCGIAVTFSGLMLRTPQAFYYRIVSSYTATVLISSYTF